MAGTRLKTSIIAPRTVFLPYFGMQDLTRATARASLVLPIGTQQPIMLVIGGVVKRPTIDYTQTSAPDGTQTLTFNPAIPPNTPAMAWFTAVQQP